MDRPSRSSVFLLRSWLLNVWAQICTLRQSPHRFMGYSIKPIIAPFLHSHTACLDEVIAHNKCYLVSCPGMLLIAKNHLFRMAFVSIGPWAIRLQGPGMIGVCMMCCIPEGKASCRRCRQRHGRFRQDAQKQHVCYWMVRLEGAGMPWCAHWS